MTHTQLMPTQISVEPKIANSNFCGEFGEWMWRGWKICYAYITNPKSPVPVLLVHGFGGSIRHWRQNISELSKHHSVYAVDLLGFGASDKPVTPYTIKLWVEQIHEFWQTFVQVPTVLVGNSIGSLTCLQAAATHPEMVRGVAMISLPDMSEQNTKSNSLRFLQDKILGVLTSPIVLKPLFFLLRQPRIVKRWASFAYACKEAVTEELLEILMTPAREKGAVHAFCAILKSMMSKDFSPCIRSIVTDLKLPSLLMWGTLDRMIPLSLAHSLLKLNPQLQLVELENAGHCAHDECPERVNFELLYWIRNQVLAPA